MGNVEMHDFAPVRRDELKELNLSHSVDYKEYCMHINGKYSDKCLAELPWDIKDSISLHERMNVSFNCLNTLPPELPFRLPHLSFLDISHNQINLLPKSIGLLFHLQELLMSHNFITELPSSFTHLVKLKKIDFSYNCLQNLPEDIGFMKSLSKINVSHNKLTFLPKSLGSCSTLNMLLAVGNCCEFEPPQSVCDDGSDATIKFLRKLAEVSQPCSSTSDFSENVFIRIRGNNVQSSVPNPHSARAQYVQIQTDTMNTTSRIRTPLLPPLGATKLYPDELKDRIIGLLYGAVIGDALGIGTEFLSPDECRFYYEDTSFTYENIIKDEHRVHWQRGKWTSNSDQMFLVLDSLLHWAGVVDELDFASRLLHWYKDGFSDLDNNDRYIQSTAISLALQEKNYAQHPHQVARHIYHQGQQSFINGNNKSFSPDYFGLADDGAIPRSIILGIPHFHNISEVISNSLRICCATHADERCKATCVVMSVVVALMLQENYANDQNDSYGVLLKKAQELGKRQLNDKYYKEEFDKYCNCTSYDSILLNEPGKVCYTFTSLGVLHATLHQKGEFKTLLTSLLMKGGHSSMNGCIAGAFLGCKIGFANLPKTWIEGLNTKSREWLNIKINALLDMMGIP